MLFFSTIFAFFTAGKESFYEELARVQKVEMDKREKDMSKSDMVATAAKKAEEEAKKRYDLKWLAAAASL